MRHGMVCFIFFSIHPCFRLLVRVWIIVVYHNLSSNASLIRVFNRFYYNIPFVYCSSRVHLWLLCLQAGALLHAFGMIVSLSWSSLLYSCTRILVFKIIQRLYLLESLASSPDIIGLQIARVDVDNRAVRGGGDAPLPVGPVLFVVDQEANQHAGVHVFDVDSPRPARVVRIEFLLGVDAREAVQSGTGVVRIEVEE